MLVQRKKERQTRQKIAMTEDNHNNGHQSHSTSHDKYCTTDPNTFGEVLRRACAEKYQVIRNILKLDFKTAGIELDRMTWPATARTNAMAEEQLVIWNVA